ncbi:hypothetical protein DRJ19_01865 [Candidatus Woesearchaeota archaeon]|nr:MAG: hypothetical protein DRJ19_01865 [Candidatus Woesearchaeota archaeon]
MRDITDKPLVGRKRLAIIDESELCDEVLKMLGIKRWGPWDTIWLGEETQEIKEIEKATAYRPKGYIYLLKLWDGTVIIEWEDR